MFELKNVNLVYDLGKEDVTYALKNINFNCEDKGLIGIIGPSGSGKSSILYVMSGLKRPTSGTVVYNGRSIDKMQLDMKAGIRLKEFGFIFQRGFLIEYLSVIDNVLVPVNEKGIEAKSKAAILLDKLGILKLADKKPYQLSGGQRQRVAIARALINNPKVVFADEPTAALDHKSASEVMQILAEYSQSALVFVVTHDTSIIGDAVRVISIWDGSLDLGIENKIQNTRQGDRK
ncbi:MAG: ABC transporter ATP-binding protein [Bacillota bacterium]|nr:ABC transporter ATP-binding protein [Bacillota bacterium]